MSSRSQNPCCRIAVLHLAVVALLCGFASLAAAQDAPGPKWEFFGGYSAFHSGAWVYGVLPGGVLPVGSRLEINPRGAGASLTYDFNRWLGITVDASDHWGDGDEDGYAKRIDDTGFSNLSIGPKFTFRHRHFSPFLEVLVGDHRLMPAAFHNVNKLGFMAGGGIDIPLSRHFALRPLQADFVYSNYRFGPSETTRITQIRGARLQAGFNFMWGGGKTAAVPPSAACTVEPAEVYAGESVTVRANGTGFNPNRTIKYTWSGSAAKAGGTDASSQVDTTGLQPGPYQMTANLSDGSKDGSATCSATFTVKQPRPPEISCSADPQTVTVGGTATIRSSASDPDNRKLTYSYRASAGDISGMDATATLNTAGTQPAPITVTCTVSDDRNPALSASATTTVAVEAPPPPEVPAEVKELEIKLSLHSIYFQTARPTEKDPSGGLLPSQEAVLTTLATGFNRYLTFKPDAHLILGGHADSRGTAEFNKRLTERRVDRAKSFLVEHGVPAGNIEVQSFGEDAQLNAEQVKQQIHDNPDLTEDERQKMLNNLTVIVLANNRRVDISLSTTGQQSVHRYPFNTRDAMALISEKGVEKKPIKKKPVKK